MGRPKTNVGAMMLAALALASGNVQGKEPAKKGPSKGARAAVAAFLASEPSYHLATLDDYSAEAKADAGDMPIDLEPVVEGDVTGDGVAEVAAIVVATRDGKPAYSAIALHGTKRGYDPPQWIARDAPEPIAAVSLSETQRDKYSDYPAELFLYDAFYSEPDRRFRWNGAEFEENYYLRGERLGVFEAAEVRAAPRADAPVVASLPASSEILVVSAEPKDASGARWYRVRTLGRRGSVGFVPGSALHKGNG